MGILFLCVIGGALIWWGRRFGREEVAIVQDRSERPRVTITRPAADASNVSPVTGVVAEVELPKGAGVDANSLEMGVKIIRTKDNVVVPARANTTGAGDAIVIKPAEPLGVNTQYAFVVTDALKDMAGKSFMPYRMTFTTMTHFNQDPFPASFEKIDLKLHLERDSFTALTIGPDHLLYAGTFAGMIHRFMISPDGTLTEVKPLTSVLAANHGPRMIMGLRFDPSATRENPVLWISHGQMKITPEGKIEGADDWTGKISRLKGPDLDVYEDVVIHLPRAYKDHLNFQMDFGPDGAIYFNQGSHTSNGDPDKKWGFRKERLMTAAVLRLDPAMLRTLPVDAQTEEGGKYDEHAPYAPLTTYATGVRSGYDMLWHSNGHLYTAVNGAAGGGGNTPGSPDGNIPSIKDVKTTADDVLLDVKKGGYYGHPNPVRGEYVMMGGNPTIEKDPQEFTEYPVGTQPDPRWQPPVFVFGKNFSANGLIEYHSQSVPALDGCILTTRYSDGDDILALRLMSDGTIAESIMCIDGFTQFVDPLDLVEDGPTGNLYVAEYGGAKISLLRPVPGKSSLQTIRMPNVK